MKKNLIIFLAIGILSLFNSRGFAQVKIGLVSPNDIFVLMPDVKAAETKLAEFQKAKETEYNNIANTFNDAFDKFVKDSMTLAPAVKETRRKELQDMVLSMSKKKQDLTQSIDEQQELLQKPIREKLMKAITDVAKENGYTYIMPKEQMLIYPDASDISDLVKKKLGIALQ